MATSSKSFPTVKVIGSNGQISLGKKFAGRQVIVEEREPGVWLVRTATVVPDDQSWFWEPEHLKKFKAAVAWAQANPPDDSTTEAILKRLHDSL
jgi:hypothetical protein